ncbi:uncharacterized protein KGF55_001390 [Candida pseudojiufengensis]|uniref:uncharacterized protein n=1 Tax=Candida pseudojiufengensis TaxID=497109 RepID=UPI002225631E|nr:uncharacterized protein KGF55_001390 [Candida pseudojiufengensis]KAI5965170.1 hypothetical protein KGF55_001390 [Candida pseudojiufengensis]
MNDGIPLTTIGSPNSSISPPSSRRNGDSTLSTLSTISQSSSTTTSTPLSHQIINPNNSNSNNSTNKYNNPSSSSSSRRVARRACLSCREKKIKCDGEPVSSITSADGTNKIIPEKTRICSNCKFLDIKCIFVQSNRGGRRKRKEVDNESSSLTGSLSSPNIISIGESLKKSRLLLHESQQQQLQPPQPLHQPQQLQQQQDFNNKENNGDENSIERVSSFILDDVNSRKKLSSPVPSTTTTYEKPKILTRSSSIDYSRSTLDSPEVRYSDPRGNNISNQHHHQPTPPLPPAPPHHQSSFQNHYPFRHPPGPHPHHHPHHPHGPHSHQHGPPPHFGHHDFPPGSTPTPPHAPPPPHHHSDHPPHHGPPGPHHHPHSHQYPFQHKSKPTSDDQLPLPSITDTYPPTSFPSRHPPHHRHYPPPPHGPPHHHPHGQPPPHARNRFFNGYENPAYTSSQQQQQQQPQPPPPVPLDISESYDNSYYNSPKPSITSASPVSYKSGITTVNESPKLSTVNQPPFHDDELSKYELPKWEILNILIDYYYIYNQPSHQIFPGKSILLKNLSLNVDSSIIHIMIATICILSKRKNPNLDINSDEQYWVLKMDKYWDNLNGFGIMACFRLLAKCTSFRFNMYRVNSCNIKIFETIYENNYIEIYSQKRFEFKDNNRGNKNSLFGTSRQCYERETILRLIWTFYINHIILLRFNQGRPYYKLSSILDDFKFDYERDHYSNNILLPLNDIDFMNLKLVNNRTSWKQLYEKSHIPSDLTSLILSSKIFENLLSKLSNDDLTFENLINCNEFNVNFSNKISDQHINIIESKNLIVINITYWFANLILRVGEVLQYNFFIYEVMKFKMCKYEFRRNVSTKEQDTEKDIFTPLICDEFLDTNNITNQLKKFNSNQWKSLIEITKALSGFVSLIEIIPSQDYINYSIVIGPTSIYQDSKNSKDCKLNFRDVISNPIEWYDAPELKATVKESWNKFPQYTLSFSTAFLSVACSLAVLTKYVKLDINHPTTKQLKVELVETGESIEVPDIIIDDDLWILKNFNSIMVSKKVSSLCEFIKYKLYYSNEEVMHDTIKRMNKLTQHLEEILSQ